MAELAYPSLVDLLGADSGVFLIDRHFRKRDAAGLPLLATLTRTSFWVWTFYLLLVATSCLGNVKPI